VDIFNSTNNRLIESGFEPLNLLEIENLGSVIYKSPINYVVMKKIHTLKELVDVRTYSSNIRNILLEIGEINIYNVYLLFCIDFKIDYETFFMIERDTKALRKYVVRKETDLNRIPFLDNLTEDLNTEIAVTEDIDENVYLNIILDCIVSVKGKLSTKEIKTSVNKVMDLVEKNYEN
jgi:hypothetical protein